MGIILIIILAAAGIIAVCLLNKKNPLQRMAGGIFVIVAGLTLSLVLYFCIAYLKSVLIIVLAALAALVILSVLYAIYLSVTQRGLKKAMQPAAAYGAKKGYMTEEEFRAASGGRNHASKERRGRAISIKETEIIPDNPALESQEKKPQEGLEWFQFSKREPDAAGQAEQTELPEPELAVQKPVSEKMQEEKQEAEEVKDRKQSASPVLETENSMKLEELSGLQIEEKVSVLKYMKNKEPEEYIEEVRQQEAEEQRRKEQEAKAAEKKRKEQEAEAEKRRKEEEAARQKKLEEEAAAALARQKEEEEAARELALFERKQADMDELRSLVSQGMYPQALKQVFSVLNGGYALLPEEKEQLKLILKMLKAKDI